MEAEPLLVERNHTANGIRLRIVDISTTIIPAREFYQVQNIIEVLCHGGIVKIGTLAFYSCTSVKRVEIRGVEEIEPLAFCDCAAVTHVECPRLMIVGDETFLGCHSLESIDLTSVKVVDVHGFTDCLSLKEAKFGWDLEVIREGAFMGCLSLERITIPLIDGVISDDNIFMGCDNLKHVDLVEGDYLRQCISSLLLEEWSDDLTREMDSIQQILPQTSAGDYNAGVAGEKAHVIRIWIRRLLDKLAHYDAEHTRSLNVAATVLQLSLPDDIVANSVLPFLEMSSVKVEDEH